MRRSGVRSSSTPPVSLSGRLQNAGKSWRKARLARCAYPSLPRVLALRAYGPEGRLMNKNVIVAILLLLAAGCATGPTAPPLDPSRRISEQDCSRPLSGDGGNLMCREVTEAERRARAAEEERQARAKREAE